MKQAFYRGFHVQVEAAPCAIGSSKNMVIAKVVEDYNLNKLKTNPADYVVYADKLEPLCFDIYDIGDSVRSKVGGLKGTVVGYEYHANRVIVMSDKINNYRHQDGKRTRYSYALSEIERYDPHAVTFVPGCWYKINDEQELFAVESVFKDDEVMLFDDAKGICCYQHIPKQTSITWLAISNAITNVQKIRKK